MAEALLHVVTKMRCVEWISLMALERTCWWRVGLNMNTLDVEFQQFRCSIRRSMVTFNFCASSIRLLIHTPIFLFLQKQTHSQWSIEGYCTVLVTPSAPVSQWMEAAHSALHICCKGHSTFYQTTHTYGCLSGSSCQMAIISFRSPVSPVIESEETARGMVLGKYGINIP